MQHSTLSCRDSDRRETRWKMYFNNVLSYAIRNISNVAWGENVKIGACDFFGATPMVARSTSQEP